MEKFELKIQYIITIFSFDSNRLLTFPALVTITRGYMVWKELDIAADTHSCKMSQTGNSARIVDNLVLILRQFSQIYYLGITLVIYENMSIRNMTQVII